MTARTEPFLLIALVLVPAAVAPVAAAPAERATLEAAEARIVDADTLPLGEVLARARRAGEATWVAYRAEALPHHRGGFCCWRSDCCHAEQTELSMVYSTDVENRSILILLRFAAGALDRVRLLGGDCPLSFGGRTVLWAGERAATESLPLLRGLIEESAPEEVSSTILAIAFHAGSEADMVELARRDRRARVRREALFWIAQSRPRHFDVLYRAALEEEDPDVARHAVFSLSQMAEPESVEHLARLLVQERRRDLRREALFWIGQSDTDEALEIVARILNDELR